MNKVLMKAIKSGVYYAGRTYAEGEEFQANPRFVRILTALHSAEVVETKPKKNEYKRKDLRAE